MDDQLYTWHELTVIRKFFTEDQWDAIYAAMADYQDQGEEESDLSRQVTRKMQDLFGS